jgi:hypothetical protein
MSTPHEFTGVEHGPPKSADLAVEGSNCNRGAGEYKKVIREAHRPINRIGRILEFGMKRGVMLPNTGKRIGPLRSE